MVHQPEAASAQLPQLRHPSGTARRPPFESVGPAGRHRPRFREESAGHVQGRLDDQVAVLVVQAAEIHKLRVTQEPGGFVIEGVIPLVKLADPERDRQGPALGAEATTGWGWVQSGIRIG
jgi:hypothetical protein